MSLKLPRGLGDHGWYGLRFIDADQAVHVRGLGEIAARVAVGALPPRTPIFVGYKRMDAPYPDAVVAVPTDEATARATMAGDVATLADLLEALEDALVGFLHQVTLGRAN